MDQQGISNLNTASDCDRGIQHATIYNRAPPAAVQRAMPQRNERGKGKPCVSRVCLRADRIFRGRAPRATKTRRENDAPSAARITHAAGWRERSNIAVKTPAFFRAAASRNECRPALNHGPRSFALVARFLGTWKSGSESENLDIARGE